MQDRLSDSVFAQFTGGFPRLFLYETGKRCGRCIPEADADLLDREIRYIESFQSGAQENLIFILAKSHLSIRTQHLFNGVTAHAAGGHPDSLSGFLKKGIQSSRSLRDCTSRSACPIPDIYSKPSNTQNIHVPEITIDYRNAVV